MSFGAHIEVWRRGPPRPRAHSLNSFHAYRSQTGYTRTKHRHQSDSCEPSTLRAIGAARQAHCDHGNIRLPSYCNKSRSHRARRTCRLQVMLFEHHNAKVDCTCVVHYRSLVAICCV